MVHFDMRTANKKITPRNDYMALDMDDGDYTWRCRLESRKEEGERSGMRKAGQGKETVDDDQRRHTLM
nr:hypothetical protein CFP56_04061 [Quercus suber]